MCDKCDTKINLFVSVDKETEKIDSLSSIRCGYCLEDDKSMVKQNGKWIKASWSE
jgi:hypothetical protein